MPILMSEGLNHAWVEWPISVNVESTINIQDRQQLQLTTKPKLYMNGGKNKL